LYFEIDAAEQESNSSTQKRAKGDRDWFPGEVGQLLAGEMDEEEEEECMEKGKRVDHELREERAWNNDLAGVQSSKKATKPPNFLQSIMLQTRQ